MLLRRRTRELEIAGGIIDEAELLVAQACEHAETAEEAAEAWRRRVHALEQELAAADESLTGEGLGGEASSVMNSNPRGRGVG